MVFATTYGFSILKVRIGQRGSLTGA